MSMKLHSPGLVIREITVTVDLFTLRDGVVMSSLKPKKVLVRILPPTRMEVAKGSWIIGPVGHHSDSDLDEEANFHFVVDQMAELDPNYLDHEVLSWNHWAVGWIEEMAYRPESRCADFAEDCRARMETYPVLSDDYLAALEAASEPEIPEDPPAVVVRDDADDKDSIDNPWLDQGGEA